MKSTTTMDWLRELLNREAREEFGEEGLGVDLQWFADHWQTVRGLRNGSLKLFQHPCQIHCPELIPSWCKEIVEDVASTDFNVGDLEFLRFLNDGEPPIAGAIMRQKAVALKANYGLSDAKRLLDHQDEIPTDMRGKYIVFTGTVLRGSGGGLCVACLYWVGGRWCMEFNVLGGDWHCSGRFPRRK